VVLSDIFSICTTAGFRAERKDDVDDFVWSVFQTRENRMLEADCRCITSDTIPSFLAKEEGTVKLELDGAVVSKVWRRGRLKGCDGEELADRMQIAWKRISIVVFVWVIVIFNKMVRENKEVMAPKECWRAGALQKSTVRRCLGCGNLGVFVMQVSECTAWRLFQRSHTF